jgi:hypothetical protein
MVGNTHFVGIAGVGLDAGSYREGDPRTAKKLGVFGFDRVTRVEQITDGLDRTIAAIQVPPNRHRPWLAGGEATVVGIDETDSVKPFVCVTHQGRKGTFALMGDGKVRFIPQTISDADFQALCTIAGGEAVDVERLAPEVKREEIAQAPAPVRPVPAKAKPPVQPPVTPAAKEARDRVAKMLAACGGTALLSRSEASITHVRGVATLPEMSSFEGTVVSHGGALRKSTMEVHSGGNRQLVVQVRSGKAGWRSVDGSVEELSPVALASMDHAAQIDRVVGMAPLLTDSDFTLEPIDETTVNGKPALGVKVTAAGKPDVSLFFGKDDHLPVLYSYRDRHPVTGKEALHETFLSDYRQQEPTADRDTLRAARVELDSPDLLDFLRRRALPRRVEDEVKALVLRLGDESLAVREKAARDLVARGQAAAQRLREAANDTDPEIARLAASCLGQIGKIEKDARTIAAIRLVGWTKPADAALVLIEYAAQADEETAREAIAALIAVGKAPVRALKDSDPIRRALA